MLFKRIVKDRLLPALGVIHRLPRQQGVLLTFDDGPDPAVTPAVLDLLAQCGAKAVFFIVGNRISNAPHLLNRILAEGHEIGNDTYFHPLDHVPQLPSYYRDIAECQKILQSHTGRRPRLFRPPLGALTLGSLVAPRLAGLRTMLWSVDIDDWQLRNRADAVDAGRRLAEAAKPGDIVMLHDDNPCVIDVLRTALPRICERQIALSSTTERVSA